MLTDLESDDTPAAKSRNGSSAVVPTNPLARGEAEIDMRSGVSDTLPCHTHDWACIKSSA